jgi:Tol biopolymer transport system component
MTLNQPLGPASPATPPVSYGSAVSADHPIVYYRLDDTGCCVATDSSGHATNGTYASSGISYGVPGLLTGDLDTAITTTFNGPAVTASDSTLPAGSSARTVEFWERTTANPFQTFLSYGVANGGQLLMVSTRGATSLGLFGYTDDAIFATPYPLNDGNPHHIAVAYDGGVTVTGYVDGQQVGQGTLPSPLATPLGSGLKVGAGFDGPFNGALDEVAIYAGALSPTQINAHWRAGVAVGCPATPTTGYAGVVAADSPVRQFRFGETSGRAALDFSSTCRAAAYAYGSAHVQGLLAGDPDGAVGNPTPAGTIVNASADGLPGGAAPRTVEFWEKTTASPWQTFLSYGLFASGGPLFMLSTRGPSTLNLIGYSDDANFTTPYPLNDGAPHHVALTYDGGVLVTAYLDGQQIGQAGLASPLGTQLGGQGLQIGNGADGPFVGTIDEVAIYATVLTPTQVNVHWQAGVAAAACPATPSSGYAGAVAASHPVRYWRFGETSGRAALDYSVSCRDAAYGAGATHVVGLLSGDADGAVGNPTPAGTIVSASADGLPGGAAPRTVEFWEKTTASPWQTFLSYGLFASGGPLFMVSTRGPSTLNLIGYNDDATFVTPYPLNDGTAHQVAVSYDGGQLVTAFLDGQQIGQVVLASPLSTQLGAQGLQIGNGRDGPFVGTLDEVAIYPTVLTAPVINAHWQAGVAAAACPATPTTGYAGAVANDKPVRYWRFGETSGKAALDYSGNCRDAAYAPGATYVGSLLPNDSDGAVGNPTPPGTIVNASSDGLPAGASARTVEFWEQTTANSWQTFVSHGIANGGQYFMVSTRGASNLSLISYNNDATFTTPYPLNDGVPHHVAVTYDGGQLVTAYLDGIQIGQAGLPSRLATRLDGQGLQIGNGIDGPFTGTLDEVAIYPMALSAAQIAAHDDVTGPVIAGTVLDGTTPMAGAVVQACTGASGGTCLPHTVTTAASGAFLLRAPAAVYALTAYPSPNTIYRPLTVGPVSVPPSVRNVTISFTAPAPNGTFTSPSLGTRQGVSPIVFWAEPSTYTVTGCKGGYGFLVLMAPNVSTGQMDSVVVPLLETPLNSGTYLAHLPALAPMHGSATVAQLLSCPGASPVFPAGGPSAGGTKVILNVGSSANQVTAVTFGSQPAQSFKVLGSGFMLAVSPPGAGTVGVTVSTPANPSLTLGTFTYSEVSGISSSSGPQEGGSEITINGHGFTDVQGVTFGGVPSPSFRVVSPDQIVAVVPVGLPGFVNVIVVGLHHATDAVAASLYQFVESKAQISLEFLLRALAAKVIGQYLGELGVGVVGQAAGRVAVGTFLDVALADGVADIVFAALGAASDILLTVAGDTVVTAIFEVAFLILGALVVAAAVALVIYLIWKLFIDPSGNVLDTAGNPVNGATATLLGGATSTGPFTSVPAGGGTIIPAVNPETTGPTGAFHWDAVAGAYEVQASASGCTAPGNPSQPTVTTPSFAIPPPAVGLVLTLSCPAAPAPAPTVTAVSPNFGLASGGSRVQINGSGLAGVTAVHFGASLAQSVTVLSPYALMATAPAGTTNTGLDVTVTTSGGTSSTSAADHFVYYTPDAVAGAPAITSVSPVNGSPVGGNTVTITGSNLARTTAVFFGATTSPRVTQVSDSQVTAIAPASPLPGRVDISVYNAAGASPPTSSDAYYYGSAIPTSLILTSSTNPCVFGQPVTFQAIVSGGATGSVQFAVDGTNYGSSVALSGGQATSPSTSTLSLGSHTVTATYAGNGAFLGSNGSLTQTVNKAATSTTVTSSQTPSFINAPVTFTAAVAAGSPGAGVPSGTVQFAANGTNLGAPVALSGGQASYTTSSLAAGHYAVTATYSGDSNFLSSVSPSITQAVRNNLIAFSSTRDGNLELYILQPDGTVQTRLTFNPAQDSEPVLSPDGTRVAFVSNRSGYPNIWVMKTAPENSSNVPKNLTNDAAIDADPSWSPDGTKIVFASSRSGTSQLWLMNADGTGVTRLTTDSANDVTAAWSPDGTKIAYASNASGKFQLYVATLTANLALGSTSRLTNDSAYDTTPAWSPDSRLIAFTSTASWNLEIWVIPAAGGTAVRETSNPTAADTVPTWSPDGSTIAFTFAQNYATQVYVITFNPTGLGTQQTALTAGSTNQLANWCCTAAP